MTTTTVSTSLVHPATTYRLDVDDKSYIYGHPAYWKADRPDVGMDANNPWGDGREDAKAAFWEFVTEVVVWPAASVIAKSLMDGMKIAGIERAKVEAGHLELF